MNNVTEVLAGMAERRTEITVPAAAVEKLQGLMETRDGYFRKYAPNAHARCAEYLIRRKAGDPRGLFLVGACGLGKSRFCQDYLGAKIRTAGDIVKRYIEIGWGDNFAEWVHGTYNELQLKIPAEELVIDELGWEPVAKRYGETSELLADIIGERYAIWQTHGIKTYIVTNLEPKQVEERYGRRITDRINEMCIGVQFKGTSARRAA